jgi:hypothetical protein
LHRPLGAVDERLTVGYVFFLAIAVDLRLELARKPCFPVLTPGVRAGGILSSDDFQLEMRPIRPAADMCRRHVEHLRHP